ncbi:MAG: pyruvate, water dikinase regulatory protein [Gammaproteobacteria bacterium]|nr:pyruvate, water dikinase regulatory protein [Gammaproteobacteria bacterium]
MKRSVFFISDSTGITAETLGHALLTQFESIEYREATIPFVTDEQSARAAVRRIERAAEEDGQRPIVFSTLPDAEVCGIVSKCGALVLDLFGAFIRPLEMEFNRGSIHATGRFHGLVDRASYEVRIDAIEYALNHDDGAGVRHYDQADVILVGVSRSGKTPTCVYLALQYGLRAANYPITEDDLGSPSLPRSLVAHKERLFGLTISPERLRQIRGERRPNSRYASLNQCRREVQAVSEMFERESITFIDTSSISIEEISTRILQATGMKRRLG